jgi:transposase-like protein
VEPVWADIRRRDPKEADRADASLSSIALALDEVIVKVNGKLFYLWRAVDHEGEALDAVVTSKRNKAAALKLLKRILKKYGRPRKI